MAYATYLQYQTAYHGSAISETDFAHFEILAEAAVDLLTNNRAAAIVTAGTATAIIAKIALATCAVADVLHKIESSGGAVQSESTGRVSVSYFAPQTREAQAYGAARQFLGPTGLMYRGFTSDERSDESGG